MNKLMKKTEMINTEAWEKFRAKQILEASKLETGSLLIIISNENYNNKVFCYLILDFNIFYNFLNKKIVDFSRCGDTFLLPAPIFTTDKIIFVKKDSILEVESFEKKNDT